MQNNMNSYPNTLLVARSDILHLTFCIINWLCLIYLEILELFMLFHMRLHGIEAFSES